MAHDVFISYSARDKAIADATCAALESRQIRCWIAPRDVLPSAIWGQAIIEGIEQSRLMVMILSADSNQSAQVTREVERAVNKGIPIVTFRVDDVVPSKAIEFFISATHWLDAMTPPLEAHLKDLADTVQVLLTRQETHPAAGSTPGSEAVRITGSPLAGKQPTASRRSGRRRMAFAAAGLGLAALLGVGVWLAVRAFTPRVVTILPTDLPTATPTQFVVEVPTSTPTPTHTPAPTVTPTPTEPPFVALPPSSRVSAQEDESTFLDDLATAMEDEGWDVVEHQPSFIYVERSGGLSIGIQYAYHSATVNRLIIDVIFGGMGEANLSYEALQAFNSLNNQYNLAKIMVDDEGDVWLETIYPFGEELDVAALSEYLNWYQETVAAWGLAELTNYVK